jgi:glycosyltransferase involved in cell wall biosynthesis
MKIAIMMRPVSERGGIGVFTANLVEQMLRIGTRHTWLLLYPRAVDLGRFADRPGVRELLVTARSKLLWDQVAVPLACRREGADVLFHPKFTVPLFAPCPAIMTLHGTGWFTSPFFGRLDVAYVRLALPWYFRRCAAVGSVSRLTTEFFNDRYHLPPGKVRTIYFGPAPNFQRVHDADELARVRARYGLPERFIFYLTKYKDAERKNIRGALEAFRRAAGDIDHDLVVGGTDCDRFRSEYRVPADGWGARVHFPGWMDQQDLPAVYTLATAFFYPSLMEAFPIPITEAMKCETPIITSDRNGLAELAGDAALLVNPEDPVQMAAALCKLLADEQLRDELKARGKARSALFSWDRCARETLDLITSAAGKAA